MLVGYGTTKRGQIVYFFFKDFIDLDRPRGNRYAMNKPSTFETRPESKVKKSCRTNSKILVAVCSCSISLTDDVLPFR